MREFLFLDIIRSLIMQCQIILEVSFKFWACLIIMVSKSFQCIIIDSYPTILVRHVVENSEYVHTANIGKCGKQRKPDNLTTSSQLDLNPS